MNKIANKQIICDVLLEHAKNDKDIIALCSDSRGSASFTKFADTLPDQFIEVGIAEQNLVSISAGLASCGKKAYAISPACFLSTRSYEQCKIDVAYSNTNVKLVGISGGVSYGALGMSHHSAQDIAALSAIPNMRIYLPCDRFETKKLIEALLQDDKPAYVRVGRNAVEDVYTEENIVFTLDKANVIGDGKDVVIVACGETVKQAVMAKDILKNKNVNATVVDMYCLKPFDNETLLNVVKDAKFVLTVEEHAPYGGLGSIVSSVIASNNPKKVINISLADEPTISGTTSELFHHYGLDSDGIVKKVLENI